MLRFVLRSLAVRAGRFVVCASVLLAATALPVRSHAQPQQRTPANAAAPAAGASAQKKRLTLEEAEDFALMARWSGGLGNRAAASFVRFLPGGGAAAASPRCLESRADAQTGQRQLFVVDLVTGRAEPLLDAAKIERAFAALPGVSAEDARRIGVRAAAGGYPLSDDAGRVLVSHANDLWAYRASDNTAARLTATPGDEEVATFSPDGRRVAFVRGNNLFVAEADAPPGAGAATAGRERALTTDGAPDKIFNGRLDWVYDEEVYGRGSARGYWWSPDSHHIAYLRLDETPVRPFTVVNHLPRTQSLDNTPYPLAGDPNPVATLGVVNVAGAAPPATVWMNTAAYSDADRLLVRVGWTPAPHRVVFQAQNREQTFLDLVFADPATGQGTRVLRETSPAWVEADAEPRFLRDGTFLWLSERTGFKHLYRYRPDGTLAGALTGGDYEVRDLLAVDEAGGAAYVSAMADDPVAENVYRVSLAPAAAGAAPSRPVSLSAARPGSHNARFDPSGAYYLDGWSSLSAPPQSALFRAANNALVKTYVGPRAPGLSDYALGTIERHRVPTRDGFVMDGLLLKPADFDPGKKYPVYCPVYAGPHAPQVADRWGAFSLSDHYLAQQGYLVWVCDNRSASGRGAKYAWTSYRNFGRQELADIEDGLAYLKQNSWVDAARIGISGWSFGGYMTAYALTHSTSFKIGIAGGTVTDWGLYDSIYTERYMSTPQNNPQGYKTSSVTAAAANLSGKLLLLHGTLDDNVHLQNALQFVYALQKAGKQFTFMPYPASGHGVGDPELRRHLSRLRTRFILENL